MDLIALAVPFFLVLLVIEFVVDKFSASGYYRSNDAINSLSTGILSTTFGYFTRLLSLLVWGFVLQNFALIDMQLSWFDASPRGIALWIIAALLWDLCYYWFHRLSHEISVLWAAHAVHHQSEDYNLSTALRQTSTGFIFGWIFYLPLFVIGFPLEILLTVNAVNLIYQFWVHTQVVRRLGVLDYILVTPSNHRVHHAQNARYIDKNYGGMLILWDRIFGTFEDEHDDDPVVFGVRKPLANWNPFWANLQVYDYLLFDAMHTRRWRDKLAVWYRRTGWRPPDVEAAWPKAVADVDHFEKFDPPVTPAVQRYVLAQFAVTIAASFLIAALFARDGANAVILPCLLLWAQLLGIGYLNEGRPASVGYEWLRLLMFNPVGVWFSGRVMPVDSDVVWWALLAYTALSTIGLLTIKSDLKQIVVE